MNISSRPRRTYVMIFLSVCVYLTAACSGTEPEETGPPDIPPLSTFVMDFSDFSLSNPPPFSLDRAGWNAAVASYENWGWAVTNVAVWNIVLTVTLAVPVASFVESFNHEPVRQTDGTWVWSYDFRAAGVVYLAELHAKTENVGVQWDMYISKEDAYDDFHWYSGFSNIAATEGIWTINKNPDEPAPFLEIEWNRSPGDETADIKYTNITPGTFENGSYIFYGITGATPYDAFYNIFNTIQDNLTEIQWNRTTREGQVRDFLHFRDSYWHQWDSTLQDIQ